MREVTVNGIKYIAEADIPNSIPATKKKGLKYCVVRTYSAGVFAGYVKSRVGKEVVMLEARRLWYWDGAFTLSQLAMEGVTKPDNCKFPIPVDEIELMEAIEITPCTLKAQESITAVPTWKEN